MGSVLDIVLRDRKHLSEDGLIIVVLPIRDIEKLSEKIEIISRGFVYVRESEDLMDEIKEIVLQSVTQFNQKDLGQWSFIKNAVRDNLKYFLFEKTKRNPMILPIIIE